MLFLAYPKSDYDEPEGALASYIEVLSGYSDAIIAYVTHNKTGVQRRSKFPPRIAELVEACDEAAADIERRKRFENWGKKEPVQAIEGPREKRPTFEELKAKYGENWGLTSLEPKKDTTYKAPTKEELAAHYAVYGLEFKRKEA